MTFNFSFLKKVFVRPSLKKCLFGIAYPGFHLVGRSVGIFFFYIYYLVMDGNGKKEKRKKESQIWKKKI